MVYQLIIAIILQILQGTGETWLFHMVDIQNMPQPMIILTMRRCLLSDDLNTL